MRRLLRLLPLLTLTAGTVWLWQTDRLNERGVRELVERLGGPPAAPFAPPTPRSGDPVSHQLELDPAADYALGSDDDDPATQLIEGVGAIHDAALSDAAYELARFYSQTGELPPGELLTFMLDSAGAVAWGPRQSLVVTTQSGDTPIVRSLREVLPDDGEAWRAGFGVTTHPDHPGYRFIAVLMVRQLVDIQAISRSVDLGQPVRIQGELAPELTQPSAMLMTPKGALSPAEIVVDDDRFTVTFTPDRPGPWTVELLAVGPLGPTPVAQLVLYADTDPPSRWEGVWPPDEAELLAEDRVAADQAAALIQEDRVRFHKSAMVRDPQLDAIAGAHSADMRDHDFVGHRSPTTGLLRDRLVSAGYRSIASGENVALNRSLFDAEAGLMRSLGHRRNLLSDDFTHFGVGVSHAKTGWRLTQVFATPRPVLTDLRQAELQILAHLNTRAEAAGQRKLKVDPRLSHAAQAEASSTDPTPKSALDRAHGSGARGRLSAWVARLPSLGQLDAPRQLTAGRFRKVGVAARQHERGQGPDINVVVLVSD